MATAFAPRDFIEISEDRQSKPVLALVSDNPYADLERPAPGVTVRGVHRKTLVGLVLIYAAMLASFWACFAHSLEAGLVMAMVTVLMIVYFSLLVGGILLADSPVSGARERSFAEYWGGPVEIATGIISGRQAVVQMLMLPTLMFFLATAIGIFARITLAA